MMHSGSTIAVLDCMEDIPEADHSWVNIHCVFIAMNLELSTMNKTTKCLYFTQVKTAIKDSQTVPREVVKPTDT
jgi:hypothetical protein